MKRHIKTFYTTTALCVGLLCGSFLCTSCEDEKTVDSYLELEDEYQTTFSPTADEAEYRITVRSNRPWQVVKKDSDADWVRPFPDEGEADGIFTLYVDENPTFETRRTELALVVDGEEYPVLLTVDQEAAVPHINVGDGSGTVSIAAAASTFTLTSSANVEWTCMIDEASASWLTYNGIDEDGVLSFTVAENRGVERTGIIPPQESLSQGGYGRVFPVEQTTFAQFVQALKQTLHTERVFAYGEERAVRCVASFCGAGADASAIAAAKRGGAQVLVSADIKHNHICDALESGLCVVQLTHYASENYGFEKIYANLRDKLGVPCALYRDAQML